MSDEASGPEFVGEDGMNTDEDVDDKEPDDSDIEITKVRTKLRAKGYFVWMARQLGQEGFSEGANETAAAMKKSAKEKIPDYTPEYESFKCWHRRMLELLGIQPSEEMDDLPIFEVVAPGWRSGEVCIRLSLSKI